MDVTSQLNLEREAGMGENAERRPAEPASTGGGHGGGRSKTRGGPGARVSTPGEDEQPPSFSAALLPASPAFRPHRRLWSYTSSPTKHTFSCFPQKNSTPQKQQTQTNR